MFTLKRVGEKSVVYHRTLCKLILNKSAKPLFSMLCSCNNILVQKDNFWSRPIPEREWGLMYVD